MGEQPTVYLPDMNLAQQKFLLSCDIDAGRKESVKKELMAAIKKDAMLPYYEHCCETLGWSKDAALVKELEGKIADELKKFDDKIADAEENLGDTETTQAMLAKADFYNKIGDKAKCMEAYETTYGKTVGPGGRLDITLTMIRVGLFWDDLQMTKKSIEKAHKECDKGGDWERRNRLKVYEGLYRMTTRDFKFASDKFLETLATFTATELISFKDYVFYAVITSMISQDRKTLKEKVMTSPEVLSVIHEVPGAKEFLVSYCQSRYHEFNINFVTTIDHVIEDRYLHRHNRYFMRAMRLNAYRQFLSSYKSVTLEAMAKEFGVSKEFIDSEIASFIASNRLGCKIDKVNGLIESNPTDDRSTLYKETIKQGDLLLNRIQKLSKVIDM